MMIRTLFAIGLLLLVVAVGEGFWRLTSNIPMSGTPTTLQEQVPQETLISPIQPATITATPAVLMITIETPASGTLVGSPVVITGRTTEYPAQGQLQYRIVDEHGVALGSGAFTVTGTSHHTATFNASLTFIMPAAPSRITMELFDRDPSSHATIASATLSLTVDPAPVLAPQGNAAPPPIAAPQPAFATPTTSPMPTATLSAQITETAAAPVATPTPAPTVIIEAVYPGRMDLGASGSINLSLKRIVADMATATSVDSGHTTEAGEPAPVGTAGAAIERAFGPGYDAVVIARVVAPAFEVQSTGDEHPLDQEEISWQWGITPKLPGRQVVIVSVDGQWRPRAGGRPIDRYLWRREFYITVDEPILSRGQISLASLVTGLAGSMLSIPWLVEQVRMWRQQRQGTTQASQRVRQRDA